MSPSWILPFRSYCCSDHVSFSKARKQGSLSGKSWHGMTPSSYPGQNPILAAHTGAKALIHLKFYCPAKWSRGMKDWGLLSRGNLIQMHVTGSTSISGAERALQCFCLSSTHFPSWGTTLGPRSSSATDSTVWVQVSQARPMRTKF